MTNANVVTWAGRAIYQNRIKGSGTEPLNLGWGISSVTASAFSDVNLFQQANPSPEARVVGVSSLLQTNSSALADTYQVANTITAGSAKTITEVGLFDQSTSLAGMSAIATSSMAAAATTVTIGANTAGFPVLPTAGNYYAQIENEVVLVTAGQGTSTLTVTRAQLGSTSAAHAIGAFVTCGGDGGSRAANSSTSSETWNSQSGANGGSMFVHADFAGIALNTSDSILFTLKVQLA